MSASEVDNEQRQYHWIFETDQVSGKRYPKIGKAADLLSYFERAN